MIIRKKKKKTKLYPEHPRNRDFPLASYSKMSYLTCRTDKQEGLGVDWQSSQGNVAEVQCSVHPGGLWLSFVYT